MTILVYKGFTRNPEIEIPPTEYCPVAGDWGVLGILNLARISWMKSYSTLQNARFTAYTYSELRENEQGE